MRRWEYKILRDNVHGYIKVPKCFVEEIIDTPVFQRLRYIEQTGMRILYPSARHDRFIHSLGTFYLGVKAFEAFRTNVKTYYSGNESKRNHYAVKDESQNEIFWDKCQVLFSIACLLHDCGHSPFSHSLEHLFDAAATTEKDGSLNDKLIKAYRSSSFKKDFGIGTGKPHERMSALLVKIEFRSAVKKIINDTFKNFTEDDLEFIARAIIGCQYGEIKSKENQMKNCIIQLLNSKSIDVDGLDYIVRDARLSGVDNAALDVDRLLGSLTIVEKTTFYNCQLDNQYIEAPILIGKLVGNIDGNIMGKIRTRGFEGSIKGQICLKGKAKVINNEPVKVIGGFAQIGTACVDSIPSTPKVESIDIEANISAELLLKEGDLDSEEKQLIEIKSRKTANVDMLSSVYFKGQMTGVFDGEVLGDYPCENTRIEVVLAFHKSSLSVLQNVVYSRNYEYLWIYAHHKVVYYSAYLLLELLRLTAKCLIRTGEKIPTNTVLAKILSMDKLVEYNGHMFFRTNDYDVISLFKECHLNKNFTSDKDLYKKFEKTYHEFSSRKYKKSVWKSLAEFNLFFRDLTISERTSLLAFLQDKPNLIVGENASYGFLQGKLAEQFKKFGMNDVVWVKADLNMKKLRDTYILLKDKPMRLKDVSIEKEVNNFEIKSLFYLYYSAKKPLSNVNLESLITFLKSKAKEKDKQILATVDASRHNTLQC